MARRPRSTTAFTAGRRGASGDVCLQTLAEKGTSDIHMIDSTTAKAHRSAAGGKGGPILQAIGRSRGGRTTKIHAVVDGCGRPIALKITPGQRGDAPVAADLIAPLPPSLLCAADTAYDSDALRRFLIERGTRPVIPQQPDQKAHPALRSQRLQATKHHRAQLLSPQGLAAHRNPDTTNSQPTSLQLATWQQSSSGGSD